MNGTQYTQKKFSAPASWHTDQLTWDYAFLSKKEFIAKYGEIYYDKLRGAIK
jgi:hypothetical protein